MRLYRWILLSVMAMAVPVSAADGDNYDGDGEEATENKREFSLADGELEWDEYYDKERSAGLQGDKLHLECKKDKLSAMTYAALSLNPEEDFTIETEFVISAINDKEPFGVVFNMKDDDNYDMMLFLENRFEYVVVEDGEAVQPKTKSKSRPDTIKLKKGKKQKVSFKMEKRGEKLRFTVNGNDEFYRRTPSEGAYRSRDFGFFVTGKNWLDVISLSLTQDLSEVESND